MSSGPTTGVPDSGDSVAEDITADQVIEMLGLTPLAHEGGMWAQTWRDGYSTAIYFLLRPDDFSALHRLPKPEMWHYYCGAAVRMLLLCEAGSVATPVLGADLAAAERPLVAVSAQTWMAAATTGEWSLVGTTMAPPYTDGDMELGDAVELSELYPAAADEIAEFVRGDPRTGRNVGGSSK